MGSPLVLLALRGIDEITAPQQLTSCEECEEALNKLKALLRSVHGRKLDLAAGTGRLEDVTTTICITHEGLSAGWSGGTSSRRGQFEVGPGRAKVTLKLTDYIGCDGSCGFFLVMEACGEEGEKKAQEDLWSLSVSGKPGMEPKASETQLRHKRAERLLCASGVRQWLVEPEDGREEKAVEKESGAAAAAAHQPARFAWPPPAATSASIGATLPAVSSQCRGGQGSSGVGGSDHDADANEGGDGGNSDPRLAAVRSFVSELMRVMLARLAAPHKEEARRSGATVEPGEGMVHDCLQDVYGLSTDARAIGRWLRRDDTGWITSSRKWRCVHGD